MPVQTRIQIRRGTTSEWANSLDPLSQGELGYDLSLKKFKVGDGTSLWSSLPWATIVGSDLVGTSGINISYASETGVSTVSVTGLTSSYLSDFSSAVSGLLPVKSIVAGNNITVTASGDKGFVISSPVNENTVKDIIGSTIVGVSGIRANYDNVAKTETISITGLTSSYIGDFNSSVSGLLNVKSLVQGTGIGIANNNGIQTISITGIPSSLITDLGNIATTQVVGRTGIALTYNAGTDTMYIDTTGVSFVGHTHSWSNITDASTKATLTELSYLSGVTPGTASAGRALVVDSSKNIAGINSITTTGNVTVGGNLVVQGTTTTVNSTTVEIGDNIIRVNTSGLNTGGMEVFTGTDTQSIVWNTSANRWELTGPGIYTSGNFIGSLSGNATTVTNGVYTTDTGTVTSTMIANNTIVDADINSSAAIAYSKLNLNNSIVNSDISSSASISDSKLATISTAGKVANSATTATSSNTSSAIVSRDANGDFSAGTITANLSGNATTVTNGVYVTDSGTVTNTMLAGSIANNKLANSTVGLGSTTISLGASTNTIAGLTSISGVSASSPTTLYYCVIDGGTP